MNVRFLDFYSVFIVYENGVLLNLNNGHISGNTEKVEATF